MPNLQRFIDAQKTDYDQAKMEIEAGEKTSHWIWYIFPQLRELGISDNAKFYGIEDFNEACDYLIEPTLFKRYLEMVILIEQHLNKKPPIALNKLMGSDIDANKLVSSLTLFRGVAEFLESQPGVFSHDYTDLKNRCNNIFSIIEKQHYIPCLDTLTCILPAIEHQKNKLEAPPKTNVTIQNTFFKPPQPDTTEPSSIGPGKIDSTQTDPGKITIVRSHANSLLISHLKSYIDQRKNEWSYHYNFLGIVAVTYFILDKLFGTDHFNIKNSEIKRSGATKLMQLLDPTFIGHIKPFTSAEKVALKEGRLGSLVDSYGGLEQLIEKAPLHAPGESDQDINFNY